MSDKLRLKPSAARTAHFPLPFWEAGIPKQQTVEVQHYISDFTNFGKNLRGPLAASAFETLTKLFNIFCTQRCLENFYLLKQQNPGVGQWLVWTKLRWKGTNEPKEWRKQPFGDFAAGASVGTLAGGPLRCPSRLLHPFIRTGVKLHAKTTEIATCTGYFALILPKKPRQLGSVSLLTTGVIAALDSANILDRMAAQLLAAIAPTSQFNSYTEKLFISRRQ